MPVNFQPDQLSGVDGIYNSSLQGQFDAQNLQQAQAQTQQSQAQAQGAQGTAMSQQASGQVAQANLPQAVAQAKSDALSKMTDNDAKMTTNLGGQISQFGAMLENIPVPARASAVTQFASRYNLPPDSPLIKGLLQADPSQLPDVVKSLGTSMVQLSAQYTQQSGLVGQKMAGQVTVAQTRATAQTDAANIRAASATNVADINTASRADLLKFATTMKQQLQDTKAKSTDQLLSLRTQQYQDNPNAQTREALDQATKIKQAVTQFPMLAKEFQDANTEQNILPGMVQNTIPAPNQSPASSFPITNTPPSGPVPITPGPGSAPPPPPGSGRTPPPPGSTHLGTSGGDEVVKLPTGQTQIFRGGTWQPYTITK